ncbi:MAG: UDP-3-O-acyl-N-acetylglucosamine deacetylase, partial [Candidatus Eremiobacteraeota bacterium]|nr:UDP-3-O-acyl-N-acetylglucosamine deacetylase [Candidatus Eremiobacteraeota bacterium]
MTQATLAAPVAFDGVGLHTGADAHVEIRPASENTGLVFSLGDDGFAVPALAEFVTDTARATVIGRDGRTVSTVEHLLSALFGMGVSNATIAVRGPEIPVTDGSGKAFADAIERVGVAAQSAPRATMQLDRPFYLRSGDRLVAAIPSDAFRVRFVADFPAPVGTEYFYEAITPDVYRDEICAARTFGYLHEVEALRERGLARGGSLENAVVFDENGPMRPLRWPNEVVRHKVLDLLGDFALLGAWPQFEVVAIKSGHA